VLSPLVRNGRHGDFGRLFDNSDQNLFRGPSGFGRGQWAAIDRLLNCGGKTRTGYRGFRISAVVSPNCTASIVIMPLTWSARWIASTALRKDIEDRPARSAAGSPSPEAKRSSRADLKPQYCSDQALGRHNGEPFSSTIRSMPDGARPLLSKRIKALRPSQGSLSRPIHLRGDFWRPCRQLSDISDAPGGKGAPSTTRRARKSPRQLEAG